LTKAHSLLSLSYPADRLTTFCQKGIGYRKISGGLTKDLVHITLMLHLRFFYLLFYLTIYYNFGII